MVWLSSRPRKDPADTSIRPFAIINLKFDAVTLDVTVSCGAIQPTIGCTLHINFFRALNR